MQQFVFNAEYDDEGNTAMHRNIISEFYSLMSQNISSNWPQLPFIRPRVVKRNFVGVRANPRISIFGQIQFLMEIDRGIIDTHFDKF